MRSSVLRILWGRKVFDETGLHKSEKVTFASAYTGIILLPTLWHTHKEQVSRKHDLKTIIDGESSKMVF